MFKAKHLGVAAAMLLVAFGAMASNFRAGDQVYLPAAGHVAGGSGTFISDVFISNLNNEAVDVSIIYSPQGEAGANFRSFPNAIHLNANERKEIVDFFSTVPALQSLTNPFGQVIFNACKAGADCTPDPNTGFNANYRNISVESRIFQIAPGATLAQNPPTAGQAFPGIPWYNYVSSNSASGVNSVFITGFRNTSLFRGNVGLVNASQFSTTNLQVTLKDGATGNQLGQFTAALGPLAMAQYNLAAKFPSFTGATATNAYVEITQISATPTGDAAANGCGDGCPAFLAYGSVLDNQSGDPTTLETQFTSALTDNQIACIYYPTTATCKNGKPQHRAVKH